MCSGLNPNPNNNDVNIKKHKNKTSKEEQRVKHTYETSIEVRDHKKIVVSICSTTNGRERYECDIPTEKEIEKDYGSEARRSKEAIRSMNDYFIFRTYFSKVIPQFNRNEKSHITSDIWASADSTVKDEFRKLETHLKKNFNHKKFVPYSPSSVSKNQPNTSPDFPIPRISLTSPNKATHTDISIPLPEQSNPQPSPPLIAIQYEDMPFSEYYAHECNSPIIYCSDTSPSVTTLSSMSSPVLVYSPGSPLVTANPDSNDYPLFETNFESLSISEHNSGFNNELNNDEFNNNGFNNDEFNNNQLNDFLANLSNGSNHDFENLLDNNNTSENLNWMF
ncbi:2690_t:CDS:2 [Entrophospora sp. SA101]|nr:2420_t:CDS:2 [Entrophospora sp. SA101]CAJ0636907.1 2690_t:CDS:2 [Entrophospora sp. SA101]CAJ0830243.1 378_t:CDS:2 [Entrophospora sp. SA101]